MNTPKPILDFLLDDDFIRYVFNPTPDLQEVWEEYFILHPDKKKFASEAGSIILGQKDLLLMPRDVFQSCKENILRFIV